MLRINEISDINRLITSLELRHEIGDDMWRLSNNYYGYQYLPAASSKIIVLLGLRSGLEVLKIQRNTNPTQIFILETNENKTAEFTRQVVCDSGDDSKINNCTFVNSLDGLMGLISNKEVELVRFDYLFSKKEVVERLLKSIKIRHLAGEFSTQEIDSLYLYRLSREFSESFCWQSPDHKKPLAGISANHEFEVSVVVPCYKVLPWLDRCLETLVLQSIKSLEIIAVDDGSPDNTGKRLDEWVEKYPGRVKVIHKINGGCASARNAGLEMAKGEFVTFIDSDDWVSLNMLEELYRAAILNSCDISQCGFAEVFEDSGRVEYHSTAWGGDGVNESVGVTYDIESYLTVKPSIWRRIYRTSFLAAHSIKFNENLRRFDDLPFQFEVFSKTEKMAILPDCHYFYRQEREGQDVAVRDDRLFVHFPIFKQLQITVMSWASARIERKLIECKINTHLWALTKIESVWRFKYWRLAAHDIFKNLTHASYFDVLGYAYKMGGKNLLFVFSCIILKSLPAPSAPPLR